MESDGKLVPILHGIPSNDFRRIPYDSAADLQTGSQSSSYSGSETPETSKSGTRLCLHTEEFGVEVTRIIDKFPEKPRNVDL
ncbi:hypothetical protein DPMN_113218 [Dreissena polymorpha]|uniref:Uncharacterized protein n=1 Tax=Dreissena polymorpha TaxID=45954 RepID=A0A9D4KHK6_DREPO|nr:hypothetical protein DPMN_113218 [Dreissena polymorpha]